jgi:hypothetical protein
MKSYHELKDKIRDIKKQIVIVEKRNPNSANWLRAYLSALDWVLDK